jgi:hypothetical protein
MTMKDIEDEKKEGLHPKYDVELQKEEQNYDKQQHTSQSSTQSKTPTMRRNNNCSNANTNKTLEQDVNTPDVNFGNGLTQYYIKHIINRTDREKVIEGIQADKLKGESLVEKLNKVNRVTAGALVKCSSFVIGKDVEEVVHTQVAVKQKERERRRTKRKRQLQ